MDANETKVENEWEDGRKHGGSREGRGRGVEWKKGDPGGSRGDRGLSVHRGSRERLLRQRGSHRVDAVL